MLLHTEPGALRQHLKQLATLDITPPQAATDALDMVQALRTPQDVEAQRRELNEDIAAGRVKIADVRKRVDAIALSDLIGSRADRVASGVIPAVVKRGFHALQDGADDLLAQYRPRFDEASQAIYAAVDAGIEPTGDPSQIAKAGGPRVAALTALYSAAEVFNGLADLTACIYGQQAAGLAHYLDPATLPPPVRTGGFSHQYASSMDEVGRIFRCARPGNPYAPTLLVPAAGWVSLASEGVRFRLNNLAAVAEVQAAGRRAPQPERNEVADLRAERELALLQAAGSGS